MSLMEGECPNCSKVCGLYNDCCHCGMPKKDRTDRITQEDALISLCRITAFLMKKHPEISLDYTSEELDAAYFIRQYLQDQK